MDPSTSSNYDAWVTKHTTANLKIDFAKQQLRGLITLELESQTDASSKEIVLDSSYISISSINVNSVTAEYTVKPRTEPNGSPLHITLPKGISKGSIAKVDLEIATTDKCTALQWLTPEQTSNKKAPFMFSQAQAIHARSMFPCQDTPAIKSTYSFRITSPHMVLASGVASSGEPQQIQTTDDNNSSEDKLYTFEQKVAIPSYLFALASGDIALAPIGARSRVATAPDTLDAAQWEFSRDVDKFMAAAEALCGPYRWGEYSVLVMPPSFPYGGMENPIFTFATPTLVAGDRQNVFVIAHELAHSWSGNLVTSRSWEHFWLNEGWTMYLERRILAAVHGEAEFDFSAVIGWRALEDAVEGYGADSPFTQLCIDHTGIDPDDAFSQVPYEKGFHMIWYLEKIVGRKEFDKFIPYYFDKFANKSLDSYDFRDTFLEFFGKPEYEEFAKAIGKIDWEGRFKSRGLPPKPKFDTSMIDVCYELAEKWKDPSFTPSSEDVSTWTAPQKIVFLNTVQSLPSQSPHFPSSARVEAMGHVYGLATSKNVEVSSAYFEVALRAQVKSQYVTVAELLGTVGRMKFVRPLYKGLEKVDRELAVRTFEKNRGFYHPICRQMVEKDLGLVEAK